MCTRKTKKLVDESLMPCGAKHGRPCSEVFEKSFEPSDFKRVIFYLVKQKRYWEVFEQFPRDQHGSFDTGYIDKYAQGLYEYVKSEILNAEEKNPDYSVNKLEPYVDTIAIRFISDEWRDLEKQSKKVVNDELLTEIRIMVGDPNISVEQLLPLARKPLSEEAREFQNRIKSIPGFRRVQFKIKRYRGRDELFMYVTQVDTLDKWMYVHKLQTLDGQNTIAFNSSTEGYKQATSEHLDFDSFDDE
jgi:hypothetical protein